MPRLPEELQDRGTEFDRLKAMSDGVFAIVLTLLVLELHVPERVSNATSSAELLGDLAALMPKIVAYVLSYLIIGLYWIVHNRLFRHIVRYDRKLLWHNLLFLLCISFLPFTTALAGTFMNNAIAWTLYALDVASVGLASVGIWHRAVKDNLIESSMSDTAKRYIANRGLPMPLTFIASIPLAFWDPVAAHITPLMAPIVMAVVERRYALPDDDEESRRVGSRRGSG